MRPFVKLRQRINRDADGSYRGNNRRLGAIEIVGLLLFAAGLVLWLFRTELGIDSVWAFVTGAIGLLLSRVGNTAPNPTRNTLQQDPYLGTRTYRLLQGLVGLACVGIGSYVIIDESSDALALAAAVVFLILGGNALFAASRSRQSWLFAIGGIF